jgi:hypothetical protein
MVPLSSVYVNSQLLTALNYRKCVSTYTLNIPCKFGTLILLKISKNFESVQKFALGMCLKRWSSSYNDLLHASEIPGLADKRKFLSLMYFYKAINGHIITPDNIIVTCYCSHNIRSSTQTTYLRPFAHSNMYHNSFFQSTISLWNSLPQDIVSFCH